MTCPRSHTSEWWIGIRAFGSGVLAGRTHCPVNTERCACRPHAVPQTHVGSSPSSLCLWQSQQRGCSSQGFLSQTTPTPSPSPTPGLVGGKGQNHQGRELAGGEQRRGCTTRLAQNLRQGCPADTEKEQAFSPVLYPPLGAVSCSGLPSSRVLEPRPGTSQQPVGAVATLLAFCLPISGPAKSP